LLIRALQVLRGQDDKELTETAMGLGFSKVRWAKPVASRSESNEAFFYATGFKK
jgi:23S rRNA U2552 (ribose-2'-O)-methylase RlmE/FtsJ